MENNLDLMKPPHSKHTIILYLSVPNGPSLYQGSTVFSNKNNCGF